MYQQGSAMKVCTDACIQGAFTALHAGRPGRVLDIGAGTGLLSLMLAQGVGEAMPGGDGMIGTGGTDDSASVALIDAIELDAGAAAQAQQNFEASPWKERLQLIREDVRDYRPDFSYSFIITNPPFYENALKSPDDQRNAAMHAVSLDYEALLAAISRLLSADGRFSVLLPYEGFQRFRGLAEAAGFVPQELLEVRQAPGRAYFRAVGIFARALSAATQRQELTIYDDRRQYTPAFIQLLKPYYLNL
ncbi:tRNA1(Val) (adenine(37)-N6)-methyltransferase [Chitinophaga sp. XS-30]|uniref:tRNA1(Val) (adenine(37)-N6)-methyltransferase n=1 Tax=Chitinophaga sp. XS-30 TaxID=2604421 RepID=UPI00143D60C2|nr:methyltransferase [Chitinophaga sp. XS-30]